jgi:hypothetical protein
MKRKPKKTPTERTIAALAKLRTKMKFREIVDALKQSGCKTSISHLSRIQNDGREASEALANSIEAVVRA